MKLNEVRSVKMVSRVVLAGVLLVVAAVEANPKGGVTFWMENVTLKCPEEGEWFQGSGTFIANETDTYTYPYTGSKDQFSCKYTLESDTPPTYYYFYIQGKACENCFELDGLVFGVVIGADLVVTVIVMIIVYKCTKKKSAGPQRAPNSANLRQVDIPLGMTSDYAPLSRHTRSNETYTTIHKTG